MSVDAKNQVAAVSDIQQSSFKAKKAGKVRAAVKARKKQALDLELFEPAVSAEPITIVRPRSSWPWDVGHWGDQVLTCFCKLLFFYVFYHDETLSLKSKKLKKYFCV